MLQALLEPGAGDPLPDRMRMMKLIDEALAADARPAPACAMVQTPAHLPQWKRRLAQTAACRQRRLLSEHPPPSWLLQ